MVNDVIATHGAPETPWAGVKSSGIGRTHSDEGLRDLCQERHVNYDRIHLATRAVVVPVLRQALPTRAERDKVAVPMSESKGPQHAPSTSRGATS